MYKLESQVIKLLLDADFFLGTKIIASSLQGTLFPIWWLGVVASAWSWDRSTCKIWFGFPNWWHPTCTCHMHARMHAHTRKRFIIPIMKLSGESRTSLSSGTKKWLERVVKGRKDTRFEFSWWLEDRARARVVPHDLDLLLVTKHLGFLISLPGCGAEGAVGSVRLFSHQKMDSGSLLYWVFRFVTERLFS